MGRCPDGCEPSRDPRRAHVCIRCARPVAVDNGDGFRPILARTDRIWRQYTLRVLHRFRVASRTYGDSWRRRPLVEVVVEMQEEGYDVAGWGMLIEARIDELPPEIRAEASRLVGECLDDGARVAARAERLRALLTHHT